MVNTQAYLRIEVDDLIEASKIPLTILPDLDDLHEHFARSIAKELDLYSQLSELTSKETCRVPRPNPQ